MKYLFLLLILVNVDYYLWKTLAVEPRTKVQQSEFDPTGLLGQPERIVLIQELPDHPVATVSPPPQPEPAPKKTEPAPPPPPAEAIATPAPPKPVETAVETPPSCFQIGPYLERYAAEVEAKRLPDQQESVKLFKKPTEIETGYLILYPAAKTPEEALANRKSLNAKGFSDAWIVDKGENQYAISLAVIHDKAKAEAANLRFRAKGVESEIKPRMDLANRWWFEVHTLASQESLVQQLGATKPREVKACEN